MCAITLLAGLALSGIFAMTKDTIAEQKAAAAAESYKAVLPEADTFKANEAMDGAIEALAGENYGTDFGKITINEAFEALDASGNTAGYVVSVTSGDGFDGNITLAVGILADGTISGIDFTELHETAGMGMRCGEDEWKGQFTGRNVPSFTLNKAGGSTSDEEIDSISGASVTSGAVVNAVNAALDFYASNVN
ncbi:MAG: RnfABCDGE type electron transport complex subunit G [Lachnospiraceae bacterium]|nr:RnfABCDGE type electron transport complex subunit G [Lachnospiraceae bacterium]